MIQWLAQLNFVITFIALIGFLFIGIALILARWNKVHWATHSKAVKWASGATIVYGTLGIIFLAWHTYLLGGFSLLFTSYLVAIVGALCNTAVMLANGGLMPVYREGVLDIQRYNEDLRRLVTKEGFPEDTRDLALKAADRVEKYCSQELSPSHKTLTLNTRLKILADIIPSPFGMASIGDVFVTIGFGLLIVNIIRAIYNFL